MSYARKLRELLGRDELTIVAGVYDVITARIVEQSGAFDGLLAVGSSGCFSRYGYPDVGLMTLNESVAYSKHIQRSVNIPVIADADNGFGNAINLIRTTQEFIEAGVAGIIIEDQPFPKRHSTQTSKEVISREEAIGKIKAAVATRDEMESDLVIVGRTSARGAIGGSLGEAIDRVNHFLESGADIAYVEGPKSKEEVSQIGREVNGPNLYIGAGEAPRLDPNETQQMGFEIQSFSRFLMQSAMLATKDATERFQASGIAEIEAVEQDFLEKFDSLQKFAGIEEVYEQEDRYLP